MRRPNGPQRPTPSLPPSETGVAEENRFTSQAKQAAAAAAAAASMTAHNNNSCNANKPNFLLSLLLLPFSTFFFPHSTNAAQSPPHSYHYHYHFPTTPPPLPLLPLPSANQLSWQLGEMAMFLHFGMNTFTDSEWGTGHADPSLFDPGPNFNASQWARVAKDAGFSKIILTAKHHDGFCLWPSTYTNYSVAASPWRGGMGDVVGDFTAAAREVGIGVGIYLSPWDRHETSYGMTLEYNEFYLGQLTELLTRYGKIKEVWLDGAKGKGEKDMKYYFDCWFELIHQLQPEATIFSDAGPDTRWVGDETGAAGSTCWSLFNRSAVTIGGNNDYQYSWEGDPRGSDWVPAECDVSIRPGWFWHKSERPKSSATMLDLYYKSVGRNCLLLLNVPPNSSGLISDEDIQVLRDFRELRWAIFSNNLAEKALVTASSTRGGTTDVRFSPHNVLKESMYAYWAPEEGQSIWELYIDLGQSLSFNLLQVQEPIQMGQRVIKFHLDFLAKGEWQKAVNGTTIGYKRLLRFTEVTTQWIRFVIDRSRADPLISFLGIYWDPFPDLNTTSLSQCNGSYIQQKVYGISSNTTRSTL